MDCPEARRLIEQGVTPGARTPLSTQLGFHLAGCVACRAYRERHTALLTMLLLDTRPPEAGATGSAPRSAPLGPSWARATVAPIDQPQRGRTAWGWQVTRGALLAMGLLLLIGAVWVGGILVRAQQNIAAMVVTAVPSSTAGGMLAAAAPLLNVRPMTLDTATATAPAAPNAQQHTLTATFAAATASSTATLAPSPAPPTATPLPPAPEVAPANGAVTVLLLGSDQRPGERAAARTDTIMLVRVDPQRGRIALLSLPRDLWVTIPGYGANRINAAYTWGEIYDAPGGGMGLARETLSALTGVPIDYTMLVNFEGFIGAIDSIGGITVNVEKALSDPHFPTMDYGYTDVSFAPGPQHMDGLTALTYSRIRHPDSDFVRLRRQQAVVIGLGRRLQERGDLQNLLTVDQITGALRGYVRTDIPQDQLIGIVWALRDFDGTHVEHYTLDANMVTFGVGNDRYAEVAVPGAVEDLVRLWYGP